MKKIFLIPLLTLLCTVMAWGSEIEVDNFADLKTQLSASGKADVVKLAKDIDYEGTEVLNIERSLTLDGQGHKITGFVNVEACAPQTGSTYTGAAPAAVAINRNGNPDATLEVDIENLNIAAGTKSYNSQRMIGIMVYDGVTTLNVTGCNILSLCDYTWRMGITVTGKSTSLLNLNIVDSKIQVLDESERLKTNRGYPIYILRPVNLKVKDSEIIGWCGLYFKYRYSTFYGHVAGSRGSIVECTNCYFESINTSATAGKDNDFGIFAFEDDGINLTLNNCGLNSEQKGNEWQSVIYMKNDYSPAMVAEAYEPRTTAQPVNVTINGDNSHINGRMVARASNNKTPSAAAQLATKGYRTQLNFTITGGTYAQNVGSDGITYPYILDETTSGTFLQQHINIPAGYTVNTIDQGGTTLYRVVPEINVSYDINEKYEEGAKGDNPNTSFIVAASTELVNNQTEAAYVQVKENSTVLTVGKEEAGVKINQTLVVKNGLDVQDNAKVEIKAGSALVIGEGGIATANAANIVLDADNQGGASLLLHPDINVNSQPNLTVKMIAKNVGPVTVGSTTYRTWHRFAMPILSATSWVKVPNVGTYLYGWDYDAQDWYKLPNGVSDMVPFAGYTLSPKDDFGTVEYTFTGQLVGNTNQKLHFTKEGFNFFGNSYTGYISVENLVDQLMDAENIEATIWMWYGQHYHAVPLKALQENPGNFTSQQKEVAPMQTFILRLNNADEAETEVSYRDAIWGNPRYSAATGVAPAPVRRMINNNTFLRITVSADDQMDDVSFSEQEKFSEAYDKGYDASKYMNRNTINMYATVNGENYSAVASDHIEGKTLTLNTTDALNYTFTFSNVAGEQYALRDNVTNQVIAIEEGATYDFAAQPNSTIEGRFEIVVPARIATGIENTEVKANVKGIYTLTGQYVGEDFKALPAGVYVVNGVKIVK